MLRLATIAALLVLNLSVWLGPAERFMSFTMKLCNPVPQLERADYYAIAGDYQAALDEYEALARAKPQDAQAHSAYGAFCYINARSLIDDLGMEPEAVTKLIREQLHAARAVDESDYELSYQYAFTLMDDELLKSGVTREHAVEAWTHVLDIIGARRELEPDCYTYSTKAAQINIHLARIESRFGYVERAQAYLAEAELLSPEIKVPELLVERNASLLDE